MAVEDDASRNRAEASRSRERALFNVRRLVAGPSHARAAGSPPPLARARTRLVRAFRRLASSKDTPSTKGVRQRTLRLEWACARLLTSIIGSCHA